MRQLPLGWRWPTQQRFETFHAGETNGAGVAALHHAALAGDAPWVFVAGPAGSGKTHFATGLSRAAPAFPLATNAMAPLRAAAEKAGRTDFTPLWSGQNATACQSAPAADITRALAAGFKD